MKRAALCLLCIFVLLPSVAFADSLDSITPNSFYSFEFEQNLQTMKRIAIVSKL